MESYFVPNKENQVFFNQLKSELSKVLPGVDSHIRLAPEVRIADLKGGEMPVQAMESAVLIILYPFHNQLYTVVILRNIYEGAHSGQISFPGGKFEKADIDYSQTALREAHEEIGINPAELEIVGQLSKFYVKPSNFIIYPFVAFSTKRPVFKADPFEVQRIIEIDISAEIDYDKIEYKTITFKNGVQVTAPGFWVSGEFMWGATAMIFSELLEVLKATATSIH